MQIDPNSTKTRYRGLILSISIFLALIIALLVFTFYSSNLLQSNTALIDTSDKTANDAQGLVKDIFDMQNSYGEDINSPHIRAVLQQLRENSKSIDMRLNAMETGGEIAHRNGHSIDLPRLKDPDAVANLARAKSEWLALKPKLDNYLEVAEDIRQDSYTQLSIVGEQAKVSSRAMNEALQNLADSIFENYEVRARNVRILQLLGVAVIFIYFIIFVFFFVKRLRQSDEQTEAARRETNEIMETVNTGLFLLDKDLKIGQQHSKALESIINEDNLAGRNLTDLLRNRVTQKDLDVTRDFVEQLYNPRVKEKLVADLNPLDKVLFVGDDHTDNRYLDFKFSRVYEGKEIARILVNVTDVSEAVFLEQRLEKERAQNDMQIEMLTTILNVDQSVVTEFINNTKEHVNKINSVLKNPGSSQLELRNKIAAIYREIHSLKGEASALQLHSFVDIAEKAEDNLSGLQRKTSLTGNDFLPLTVQLDELLTLSKTIEKIGERISAAVATTGHQTTLSSETSLETLTRDTQDEVFVVTNDSLTTGSSQVLNRLAQEVATRHGKQVKIDINDSDALDTLISDNQSIKEILIQLIRNSVVHGIETPAIRQQYNKSDVATIKIDIENHDDNILLSVQDDGQGIDYDAIRNKLVASGNYEADEVSGWSKKKLLNILFSSGFSTLDTSTEDAGRGVGLDIIKDRVQSLNGRLGINSKPRHFTRFSISMPAQH